MEKQAVEREHIIGIIIMKILQMELEQKGHHVAQDINRVQLMFMQNLLL